MLLRAFPNLDWLKSQANTRFANRKAADGTLLPNTGWPNVVMNAKATGIVRDNIRGPLSIFTNISGTSQVAVDGKHVAVTPDTLFITNADQFYTLELNKKESTETLNIHFGEHFAESALMSFTSTPEQALEFDRPVTRYEFHNRLIPVSSEFRLIIEALKANTESNKFFEEEKLYQLLNLLVAEQEGVAKMEQRLAAVKASTKAEILKRLIAATDFLYSNLDGAPDLDELARISCLSKFHFLRLFKAAYHKTPHRFITELKINKAKELLAKSNSEVNMIAEKLGFRNSSSFSRLFYNQTGIYPSQFRAAS